MKRGKKENGYITVYLSLTLAILLSLIMTLIEGVRMQTIRFQTECVTDIGLNSIFAEYNREVLNQYGLLLIDTSYGFENPDSQKTKSHLLQYMNMNFIPPGAGRIPGYKDLTAVHADNAVFTRCAYASDKDGDILKYQIIRYMEEKKGISYIKELLYNGDYVRDNADKAEEYDSRKRGNKGIIDSILEMLNAQKAEDETPVGIDNPADYVESVRSHSILDYAIADPGSISHSKTTLSTLISHRGHEEGDGLFEDQKAPDGILNQQLFLEYLFDKCGRFGKEKEDSRLKYQIEYLLHGKAVDYDNLKKTAEEILKVRYAVNVAYLFSDTSKMAEAEELALLVAAGIMQPELIEAIKISILFAWAYAESVQDVRIVFDGETVAKVKTADTFNTPLSQLLTFTSHLGEYKSASGGLSYEDFLKMFMALNSDKNKKLWFMDVMEMDIRLKQGNSFFALDHCIYQVEAQINVSSKYGHGYEITRRYTYE